MTLVANHHGTYGGWPDRGRPLAGGADDPDVLLVVWPEHVALIVSCGHAPGGDSGHHQCASFDWQAAGLTRREREVATLVARGLRNRELAEELVISEKTAKNHLQRVLEKLGARSRTQVAPRAAQLGLEGQQPTG